MSDDRYTSRTIHQRPVLTFALTGVRADGWPLCPHCGEDELWSPFVWNGEGEKPPMEAWIAAGLRCYRCNWSSERAANVAEVSRPRRDSADGVGDDGTKQEGASDAKRTD